MQINRANLVDSNSSCSEIIKKQTHFDNETSLTILFEDESVLQAWEWCLKGTHSPFSWLAHWRSFSIQFQVERKLPPCVTFNDSLCGSNKVFVPTCWERGIDCTLSTAPFPDIFKLVINTAPIGNETIVYTAWNIKTYDGDCPIGTKNNDRPNIMVVLPTVEKVVFHINFWGSLQFQLKPVHCTPDSIQDWMSVSYKSLVMPYCFSIRHLDSSIWFFVENCNQNPTTEAKVHAYGICRHAKDHLKDHAWSSGPCPCQAQPKNSSARAMSRTTLMPRHRNNQTIFWVHKRRMRIVVPIEPGH